MKPQYVALTEPPRAWISAHERPETLPTMTVFVDNDAPVETGLLDAAGVPLYRVQGRKPMGFKP